jgi:hypothetical protein
VKIVSRLVSPASGRRIRPWALDVVLKNHKRRHPVNR